MCKSSSLVFVLSFAFFFRLETFSLRLVGVILLISIGVLLMVATETHFVLGGFILVISASALGGLRWSLTQMLMRDKRAGLNHPVATIFWLAPIMGLTMAIVSVFLESWSELPGSRFLDSPGAILKTAGLLIFPGVIAFSMVLTEY
jgi:solute carrier family 35 protein C2